MRDVLLAAALVLAFFATAAAEPPVAAQTVQPRAYGHVLGDVLTQRVRLQHAGRELQPAALPPADRVGPWLERRTPRVELDAEGGRWLTIDYQLINAPRAPTSTALPPLTLATTAGVALAVPAWPLSIGPLTSADVAGLPALQPDRPVAPRPTAALARQLRLALIALAGVLAAWLAWWAQRQWREARRLPFARACARLRRLDSGDPAWLALHEAINQSAGRVVHAASLPRLFDAAPQWRPLRAELERFFAASNARFFGDATAGAPTVALRELGRALRAIEQRHQR